jgi:ubiquitin C-terminal hydrolase
MGSLTGGHYFAFAKHGEQWCKLNDSIVSSVTVEEMEAAACGAELVLSQEGM